MTTQTEALKLALEALDDKVINEYKVVKAITAIKEALAQPEQYQQANPLGGPAKVFDAMAAAIRAGDSYESVLKQFGYQLAQPAVALQHKQEPYGYLKLNTGKFVNEVEGLNPMKDKRYLPLYTTPPQRTWVGLMRGVRVDGDTVVISVKGGNDAARELCGELINEMNK